MKAYALGTLLLVVLVLAGCSGLTSSVDDEEAQLSTEEVTKETVVEETLDVEIVEEDFSSDEQEDDYGDII